MKREIRHGPLGRNMESNRPQTKQLQNNNPLEVFPPNGDLRVHLRAHLRVHLRGHLMVHLRVPLINTKKNAPLDDGGKGGKHAGCIGSRCDISCPIVSAVPLSVTYV